MHLRAACSLGKCPRALTARRMRALTDSIALVVQMTLRISTSKARKGTNSAQAFSHSWTIAGYRAAQASQNSRNRSIAAASVMQNLTGVRVFFLGAAGALPLGVAMLLAAIAGALLVAL